MPLIASPALPDDIRLACWQIAETEHELLHHLGTFPALLDELAEVKAPNQRVQHLAARMALGQLLNQHLPQNATNMGVAKSATGKPLLQLNDLTDNTSHPTGHNISLSHTAGLAAAALASHPVAVDIEDLSRKRAPSLASMFMHPEELQVYHRLGSIDRQSADVFFYKLWCGKECLFKLYARPDEALSFRNQLRIFLDGNDLLDQQGQMFGEAQFSDTKHELSLHFFNLEGYLVVVGGDKTLNNI